MKTADFWASDIANIYGYGREISSLPFRCNLCGEKASSILPLEYIPDDRRKQYVWTPMRVK